MKNIGFQNGLIEKKSNFNQMSNNQDDPESNAILSAIRNDGPNFTQISSMIGKNPNYTKFKAKEIHKFFYNGQNEGNPDTTAGNQLFSNIQTFSSNQTCLKPKTCPDKQSSRTTQNFTIFHSDQTCQNTSAPIDEEWTDDFFSFILRRV